MKILYIHGFNGTPEGAKLEMLRRSFRQAEIIAPQHDSRAENVFQLLDGIAREMELGDDVILGSSLGGFWANYFSQRYGLSAVLVNPSIKPSRSLARNGYPFAAEYEAYEQPIPGKASMSPRSVLLAEDDEVLPYREACDYFGSSCGVSVFPTGGHRMIDPESLERIRMAIESIINHAACWGIEDE